MKKSFCSVATMKFSLPRIFFIKASKKYSSGQKISESILAASGSASRLLLLHSKLQVLRSSSTPNWLPRSRFHYDKCRLVDKVFHFLSLGFFLQPSPSLGCARVQWTFLLSRSHDEKVFGKSERNSVLFVSVFTFLCRLSQSLGHASGHEYNYLRKLMTIEADKSYFGCFRLATGLFWPTGLQSEISVWLRSEYAQTRDV